LNRSVKLTSIDPSSFRNLYSV